MGSGLKNEVTRSRTTGASSRAGSAAEHGEKEEGEVEEEGEVGEEGDTLVDSVRKPSEEEIHRAKRLLQVSLS